MQSLQGSTRQADEISKVLYNRLASRETSEQVLRSWTRCVNDYHLDPEHFRSPSVVTHAELRERREKMRDVVACAKLEMTTLYQQLADPDLSVVLTDKDGVIVHMVSSVAFAQAVEDAGFRLGGVWSEREAGTNGMGTCLVECESVAIRQREHFYSRYTSLTCSAAPIFDNNGDITAVLDVTSRSQLLQQHSLVLVGMSRQMIENRLLDARFGEAHMIHFHTRPEFVYTLHGGKLAIADDGSILAANRSALFQLGFSTLAEIRRKNVTAIFNASLDDMLARSTKSSFHPVTIYRTDASNRFFVVAQRPHARSEMDSAVRIALPEVPLAPPRPPLAAPAVPAPILAASDGIAPERARPAHQEKIAHLEFGDPKMAAQVKLATRVITRRIPILINGETGTGKEVFAQALHSISPNAGGAFVAVNCASLPENLIESELFGYRAGAFTGAHREGRRGRIVQANGGTLFLDEIGDMPLTLQARLLRVLEERQVTPLGSEAVIKVDFQLISATHRNLAEQVERGHFREDLFYRLKGIEAQLPPLREREDKLPLIEYLLSREETSPPALSYEAQQVLLACTWPGNIRQLRHVLQTALALCDGNVITCAHLPPELTRGGAISEAEDALSEMDLTPLNAIQLNERDTVLALLDRHRWNVSNVAKVLGISRNTLYRKMHRLHIKLSHVEGCAAG